MCLKNYEKFFRNIIKNLSYYFLKKIKFSGKSYKLERNQFKHILVLNLKFGFALKSYSFLRNLKLKQIKKTKVFLWFINFKKINKIVSKFINLRPLNSYTQRGLRLNKQLLQKRHGKKSTYV